MTKLSVNLNKIALLRNSRGRDYPNVCHYAKRFIDLGVHGITIHPRPDERHATRRDAYDLAGLLSDYPEIEFNIEGNPTADFMRLVLEVKPDQCTLVPDEQNQLTSDHGWDVCSSEKKLNRVVEKLNQADIRISLFLDPDLDQIKAVSKLGCQRIELYTEAFANSFYAKNHEAVFEKYKASAHLAHSFGLGVNAGHDLDLNNLGKFLEIENILEVSIGHALTIECIDYGIERVVEKYIHICR